MTLVLQLLANKSADLLLAVGIVICLGILGLALCVAAGRSNEDC